MNDKIYNMKLFECVEIGYKSLVRVPGGYAQS